MKADKVQEGIFSLLKGIKRNPLVMRTACNAPQTGIKVHARRLLAPKKSCGVNVSCTWRKNTSFCHVFIMIVLAWWTLNAEVDFFSCHPASECYGGANKTLLTFNILLYRFWEDMCFQIRQYIHYFLEKEEDLVQDFVRDFPTSILHTASQY